MGDRHRLTGFKDMSREITGLVSTGIDLLELMQLCMIINQLVNSAYSIKL